MLLPYPHTDSNWVSDSDSDSDTHRHKQTHTHIVIANESEVQGPYFTVAADVNAHHYNDVIMTTIASQITSLAAVYSTVYSDADQRKHQSSASLAFVWGIHHLMTSSCSMPSAGTVIIGVIYSKFLYQISIKFSIKSHNTFVLLLYGVSRMINDQLWK